jgi:hypothetical protein
MINPGEIYFYIARGFNAIDKTGQAIDAYEKSLDYYSADNTETSQQRAQEIETIIKKLRDQ